MTVKDIDRIFVISLPNSERKQDVKHELNKNFIWFNWYDGIENKEDGAQGLKQTFKKLFTECLEKNITNVLVFEDDAVFTCEKANEEIGKVLNDVPEDYHIVKFGANLLFPVSKVTENINRCLRSYALHSCLYSKSGMELILEFLEATDDPVDVIVAKFLEPLGHCYVSGKMIVNQKPTKSTIFKFAQTKHGNFKYYEPDTEIIRWDLLMNEMWERNTRHLNN